MNDRKETMTKMLHTLRQIAGETTCMVCYEDFDSFQKKPMVICLEQHNCCEECVKPLQKCPLCRMNVCIKNITKNRLLCSLLEQIEKLERKIALQQKLQCLKNGRQNFKKNASCTQWMVDKEKGQKKVNKFQIRKVQGSMGSRNKMNYTSSSLLIGR